MDLTTKMKSFSTYFFKFSLLTVFSLSLTSCANFRGDAYQLAKQDDEIFEQPLREPDESKKDLENDYLFNRVEPNISTAKSKIEVRHAPQFTPKPVKTKPTEDLRPRISDGKVDDITINNLTIEAFINEVFGRLLSLNFVIENSVKEASDLVTLRISEEISQDTLYTLANETLKSYGVQVSLKNDILYFSFNKNILTDEVPLVVSGQTLPDVPVQARPIFHIYPLTSVRTARVRSWLSQMFSENVLRIYEDPTKNALLFKGRKRDVEKAISAAKVFDQPSVIGSESLILRPETISVTELYESLVDVLTTEGFDVALGNGQGAIKFLILKQTGQLVVFARTAEILEHISNWVELFEIEKQESIENGVFTYEVRNTQAEHIVETLNQLAMHSGAINTSLTSAQKESDSTNTQTTSTPGRYVVDKQLNVILFSGSGKEWKNSVEIIEKLDRPAPSVMVEVIIAEIQLNDSETSGVEWLAFSSLDGNAMNLSTLSGLGVGSSGFRLTLDSAGETRAILNAFYKNERANIRSRPRILVKSGGEASIDVGNEIPLITSNSQSTNNENAPIVQNISYRKTGVILDIKPTVHSSGFVDIDIRQELSEAVTTSSSTIDSPTILNRSINTTVSLKDGGSVLLGGLISSTTSKGQQGVPILGKLPLVGNLFKTDTNSQDRTELMIMVVPYIIDSGDETERLNDDLQRARIKNLTQKIINRN